MILNSATTNMQYFKPVGNNLFVGDCIPFLITVFIICIGLLTLHEAAYPQAVLYDAVLFLFKEYIPKAEL